MNTQQTSTSGPSHRTVEIGVAIAILAFGALAMYGSVQAGIGWGAEGPKAGFFPFYVGLALVISSVVNLWNAFRETDAGVFAEWSQLRQVMAVVIPTTIYVAAIPLAGMYVASALYLLYTLRVQSKLTILRSLVIAVVATVILYVVFERLFEVSLPHGWLGAALER